MGASAQLRGKISHLHHAHTLPVFFSKQGHGPRPLRLLKRHDLCLNRNRLCDLLVDDLLHSGDLLLSHGREMAEVKTKPLPVHKGTGLLHVSSQHLPKGLLKQMGCAVVFAGVAPACLVHLKPHGILALEHSPGHFSDMAYLAAKKLYRLLHSEFPGLAADDSHIAALAAHGGVKRSLLHNNRSRLAVCQRLHQLALRGEHRDL